MCAQDRSFASAWGASALGRCRRAQGSRGSPEPTYQDRASDGGPASRRFPGFGAGRRAVARAGRGRPPVASARCPGRSTDTRHRPSAGAGVGHAGGALRRPAGARMSPAGVLPPRPTSTRLATSERTIWWQNEPAEMSKRSRRPGGPAVRVPARTVAAGAGAGVGRLGALVDAPAGAQHPAHHRLGPVGPRLPPAERTEVVAAEQHVGGRAHGHEVERVADVPGDAGQQRVGRRARSRPGSGRCGRGRAASVEVVADRLGPAHHHLGGQLAVEGAGEAGAVVGDGREVDVDDLAPRVHPGVGAPGAGERAAVRSGGPCARGPGAARRPRSGPRAGRRSRGRRHRRRRRGASSAAWQRRRCPVLRPRARRTRCAPSARCHPGAVPA